MAMMKSSERQEIKIAAQQIHDSPQLVRPVRPTSHADVRPIRLSVGAGVPPLRVNLSPYVVPRRLFRVKAVSGDLALTEPARDLSAEIAPARKPRWAGGSRRVACASCWQR